MTQKLKPGTSIAIPDTANVASLREKTGVFRRLGAALAVSTAAGRELTKVETRRVRELGDIACTALALAGVKIKSAMVAAEMPQVGALAVTLNANTTAVDQALTNGAAAEVATHIQNRADNLDLTRELREQNKISEEEATTLESFATSDAAGDIERSRLREAQAKQAVQHLHDYALGSIAKARVGLD